MKLVCRGPDGCGSRCRPKPKHEDAIVQHQPTIVEAIPAGEPKLRRESHSLRRKSKGPCVQHKGWFACDTIRAQSQANMIKRLSADFRCQWHFRQGQEWPSNDSGAWATLVIFSGRDGGFAIGRAAICGHLPFRCPIKASATVSHPRCAEFKLQIRSRRA